MAGEVKLERDGAILVITIDRPRARNAIDHATAVGLAAALTELDADPELVVGILTGAGGNFSAGMDLKAFLRGERPEIEGRGFAGIAEAPPKKPLIAAVEGYALAGGCEVVLACDLVVAAETATFGLPEVTRGLIAGSGGLVRLPQRIPRQIALEYALTGRHFAAAEAHRWGFVNTIVPVGEALEGAKRLAREIAKNAPLAIQETKRLLNEATTWPAAEVWARQRELVDAIVATNDAKEGAAAFAEKREPRWRGN